MHATPLDGMDSHGYHNVDVHFGKPDIPKFIAETLRKMAVAGGNASLVDAIDISQANTRKFKRGRSREVYNDHLRNFGSSDYTIL